MYRLIARLTKTAHTLQYWLGMVLLLAYSTNTYAKEKPTIIVFAAASLTNAVTEIATLFEATHAVDIKTSFASSSVLAKQIQRGAPADLYISADERWMDYLINKRLINANSRQALLANRLALIKPKQDSDHNTTETVNFKLPYPMTHLRKGKLCTGQVDAVPVGVYAKQALQSLNWWHSVKSTLVGVQNVRTALAYVERGECEAGIVYQTDAMISDKVTVLGLFPSDTHQPIRYPIGLTVKSSTHANQFQDFLWSAQSQNIFKRYHFTLLSQEAKNR